MACHDFDVHAFDMGHQPAATMSAARVWSPAPQIVAGRVRPTTAGS